MQIDHNLKLIIDEEAFEGVKRVAKVIASDIELVTDICPEVTETMTQESKCILFATLGKSIYLDKLIQEEAIDVSGLYLNGQPKRECFLIKMIKDENRELLVICGSDKRGTIYGMFTLSEYIGVTPLIFWGDTIPAKRENVQINRDIEILSKEPSVRYRGFFINDEWPCFGTWVTTHYGDFNAQAYENVFLFLLRMKGSYLWPAMWSASFPLDGPGSENEILADIYGVVMGYSHHEPCLRASEEWDKVKGEDSGYGTAWDFYSNEEGLINYWRDGLRRSGRYENIITIGMRGERDSAMLGEDSDLSENINILKRIITAQRKLIREEVNSDIDQVPQMLALYKEVEPYFYGNKKTKGLKDWEELDNVICMLCEDNFGNMRTLPTEEERNRKGGYGMYYHLDYHGGPVSYEWVDSTPLSKIWDQMCMAYEYGIRSLWIVNVGDVKFHELPLSYFMALAYDYDRYGITNMDSPKQYMESIIEKIFPDSTPEIPKAKIQKAIAEVFFSYIRLNYLRRPESNHPEVYHPCHFTETDRMLESVLEVEQKSLSIYKELDDREKISYYSMIHFPAMASMNLLKMHLYAGKNHHYASQNKPIANTYADKVEECIQIDNSFIREFADFLNGKWNGMQLASHIGFTKWNDDDAAYPVIHRVIPHPKSALRLSRADEERTYGKIYGGYEHILIDDFLDPATTQVVIEATGANGDVHIGPVYVEGAHGDVQIDSADEKIVNETLIISNAKDDTQFKLKRINGEIKLIYKDSQFNLKSPAIEAEPVPATEAQPKPATETIPVTNHEPTQETIQVAKPDSTPDSRDTLTLFASDSDRTIAIDILLPEQDPPAISGDLTHQYGKYGLSIPAGEFIEAKATPQAGFVCLSDHGKYGCGMKVFPVTCNFKIEEEKPELTYRFTIKEEGTYKVVLYLSPTNPVTLRTAQKIAIDQVETEILPATFNAGSNSDAMWCEGVLSQEHICTTIRNYKQGTHTLTIGALSAGVILEKIEIYPEGKEPPVSYLKMPPSARL